MFGIVLLMLSVCWREMEYGMCADKLEYWQRDPKYDIRRTTNETKVKIKNIKKLIDEKQKSFLHQNTTIAASKRINKFQQRPKASVDLKSLTTSTDISKGHAAWPKVQKRSNVKKMMRSTRVTPHYLVQKPGQAKASARNKKRTSNDTDYDYNLRPYDLKAILSEIAADIADADISLEVIGRTAEYNDIILLKASAVKTSEKYFRVDESKYANEVTEKKIIFIVHGLSVKGIHQLDCLHHVESLMSLLNIYFAHLDKFDIYLIPMANPDGFANEKDFIWDKNMSLQDACRGVALDRNFDVSWNYTGLKSSCSQQYPGTKPFSEPETMAIRDVFQRHGHKIVGYINVHAGTYTTKTTKGDAVLYPRGYSDEHTDDDQYIDLRGEIEEAMRNASFQVISVSVDTLYNWYGKVTGTSVDYASTVYGIPYSMEFVMQPYENDNKGDESLNYVALIEIWKRVIDTVFINIYQHINQIES